MDIPNTNKNSIGTVGSGMSGAPQYSKRVFLVAIVLFLLGGLVLIVFINRENHRQTAALQAAEQRLDQLKPSNGVQQLTYDDVSIADLTASGATIKNNLEVGGNVNINGTLTVNGQSVTGFVPQPTTASALTDTSGFARLAAGQAFTGANKFSNPENVFNGDGSGLKGVTATTLNGQNGAFYQDASHLSAGTVTAARLPASATLQGNAFNGASQLVQLDGSGKLPVLDGSALTNVTATTLNGRNGSFYQNASNLNAGTIADSRLSANVTLQGNTFNGASQLVQLTGGGLLPVLSGGNLTNLNGSSIASGTVADTRLSSNVALLNRATQTFSGSQLFQNTSNSTTAFQIQNTIGSALLAADTQNNLVGIGMQPLTGTGIMLQAAGVISANTNSGNVVAVGSDCGGVDAGICFNNQLNLYDYNNGSSLRTNGQFDAGQLYSVGGLSFGTYHAIPFTTPTGATVDTKISIPLYDPGAFSQLIALGIPDGSAPTARAITVFDARTTTNNQPPLGVISPDESNIFGITWDGTITTGFLKIGSGGGITLRSGTTDLLALSSSGSAKFNGPSVAFSSNVRGINLAIANGATLVTVTFGTAYADANYAVQCTPSYNTTCYVTNKTASGFVIRFGTAAPDASQTVDWFVTR